MEGAHLKGEPFGRLLAQAESGAPVPTGLISTLAEAHTRSGIELRGLPGEEAERTLSTECRRLEARLHALEEGGPGAGPAALLGEALALGAWTRRLIDLTGAAAGEPSPDPLAFVEEEAERLEQAAAGSRLAESARALRAAFPGHKLRRFLAEREPADEGGDLRRRLDAAWRRALGALRIQGAVEGAPHEAGSPPGVEAADLAALRTGAERAADRCAALLREVEPGGALGFLDRAAAEVLDRSSAVLSETSTARPARRVPALRALGRELEALIRLLDGASREREEALVEEDRRRLRARRVELSRARRSALRARRSAEAASRLERAFGPRLVRRWEGGILLLVLLFLAVVILEWRLARDSPWLFWVHLADVAVCAVFQTDFLVRWFFARWGAGEFLRRFFFESLPAIPYGSIIHWVSHGAAFPGGLDELRALLVGRLLGVQRVALPLIRLLRLLVFLVQGTDRAVERFRPALDREVVLFEPPAGSTREDPDPGVARRALALEARRQRLVERLLRGAPGDGSALVLGRTLGLLDAEARLWASLPRPLGEPPPEARAGIRLERLIHDLLDCDAALATAALGHEGVERAGRWLRILDFPVIRRGPVVRRLVEAARGKRPPEAAAAAAQALGETLQRFLGTLKFLGDLSGITTGPQILDRLATAMIAATNRPATRLLLFGALFVLLKTLFDWLNVGFLEWPLRKLEPILGLPLLVLGSACLMVLLVGMWFKRIAGEALDLYLRTADAHFYPLLKTWKQNRLDADLRALYRAVLLRETTLRGGVAAGEEEWMEFLRQSFRAAGSQATHSAPPADPRFTPYHEDWDRVALLYRDFLDGPLLHRTDDTTSLQLLGGLVVHDIRFQTLGFTRKDLRKLAALDLGKERFLGLGPYFWFRFITESLAIECAKLVIEYNTSCIPGEQLAHASPRARKRFEEFLAARRVPWEAAVERRAGRAMRSLGEPLATDEFNALSFLAVDPERDEAVRRLFGEEVLRALLRDRRGVVRDIFGTRPYHLLPREKRVINPYRLYLRYLAGPRLLFLPLVVALAGLRVAAAGLHQVVRLVEEVLGRDSALKGQPSRVAPFAVALRKVHRMRKPFFSEALRLRAAVDLEYLGLSILGLEGSEETPGFRADLDRLGALQSERRPIEEAREAALGSLRRLRGLLGARGLFEGGAAGLLRRLDPSGALECRGGEAMRALATAYATDHGSLRSLLHAREDALALVDEARSGGGGLLARAAGILAEALLRLTPRGRRRRRVLGAYLDGPGRGAALGAAARLRVLRTLARRGPRAERALELAVERHRREASGEDLVLEELRQAARDHASWTRKVVTARALQAITELDLQCYRDLIWSVGGYGEEGDTVCGPVA